MFPRNQRKRGRTLVRLALSISLLATIGLFVATQGAPTESKGTEAKPTVGRFVWRDDTTEGIAVTYRFLVVDCGSAAEANDVRISLQVSPELGRHWQVRETTAFLREDDNRIQLVREGPFPLDEDRSDDGNLVLRWTMHRLNRPEYEVDFYLHRTNNGLPFAEARELIEDQQGLVIDIQPLD